MLSFLVLYFVLLSLVLLDDSLILDCFVNFYRLRGCCHVCVSVCSDFVCLVRVCVCVCIVCFGLLDLICVT